MFKVTNAAYHCYYGCRVCTQSSPEPATVAAATAIAAHKPSTALAVLATVATPTV